MLKKNYKQSLGKHGENLAKKYYQSLGYKIIKQNYWTRYGELDLVCQKNKAVLIVEVKTRRGQKFGYGEEIINQKKIDNLIQAYQLLQNELELPNYYEIEICVIELKNNQKTLKRFLI